MLLIRVLTDVDVSLVYVYIKNAETERTGG